MSIVTRPAAASLPVAVQPEDAERYLAGLRIPAAAVCAAIEHGELRAADMDSFHPPTAAGLTRWIHVVGDLRRWLVTEKSWHKHDHQNRPTCASEDGKVTLSVVGGDPETGIAESVRGPRAAHKRGAATKEALNGQLELIEVAAIIGAEPALSAGDPPPVGQWFLVYHRAEDAVRIEVSKALGIDGDGQFTGWLVRVVLEPWVPEDGSARPGDIGGGDVDFTIIEAS